MKQKSKAIAFSVLIGAGYLILFKLIGFAVKKSSIPGYWTKQLIVECIGTAIGIGLLALFRKLPVLREKGRPFSEYSLPLMLILVFFCGFRLIAGLYQMRGASGLRPVTEIVLFCLSMLMIGVSEELVFRGLIQNLLQDAFRDKQEAGIRAAVFLCGTLFGLLHLMNVFSGIPFSAVAVQAVGAGAMGWILCALYARCRNIWILSLVHAFFDLTGMFQVAIIADGGTVEEVISSSAGDLTGNPLTTVLTLLARTGILAGIALAMLQKKNLQPLLRNEETK